MSITINARQDYSYLFSGLSSSTGVSGQNNFLADYASIKNGSYSKLLKAYYNKTGNAQSVVKQSTSTSKDSAQTLSSIQSSTDSLKESADALLAKGNKSLFAQKEITSKDENGVETTTKGYDTDAIYKAVNTFVKDYNSVIKATSDSNSSNINTRTQSMITATDAHSKLLGKLGITINKDHTLSIDEETFKEADMSTAKSLFNTTGAYGYRMSAQASLINFAADSESAKANTYNSNGFYSSNYSSGNLFNSFL